MQLIILLLAILAIFVGDSPAPTPQVKAEPSFLTKYCKPIETCNITEADLTSHMVNLDLAAPSPVGVICIACKIVWDRCTRRNRNNNPWLACHNELCRVADCRKCGYWDCHSWGWA